MANWTGHVRPSDDEPPDMTVRARLNRHTNAHDTWQCACLILDAMGRHAEAGGEGALASCLADVLLHLVDIGERLEWPATCDPAKVRYLEEVADRD